MLPLRVCGAKGVVMLNRRETIGSSLVAALSWAGSVLGMNKPKMAEPWPERSIATRIPGPFPGRRVKVLIISPHCVLDLLKDLANRKLSLAGKQYPLECCPTAIDCISVDGQIWLYLESPEFCEKGPDGVPDCTYIGIVRDGEIVVTQTWTAQEKADHARAFAERKIGK